MYQPGTANDSVDLVMRPRARPFRVPETAFRLALASTDLLLILIAVTFTPAVYFYSAGIAFDVSGSLPAAISVSIVAVLFLIVRRAYRVSSFVSGHNHFGSYTQAWLLGFAIVLIEAFLTKTSESYSRGAMVFAFMPGFILAYGARCLLFHQLRRSFVRHEIVLSSVFLIHIGIQDDADALAARLLARGVVVAGMHCVPVRETASQSRRLESLLVDAVEAARRLLALGSFDSIYLSAPWAQEHVLGRLQHMLRRLPAPVVLLPDNFASQVLHARHVELSGILGYEIQRAPMSWGERATKRLFDIVVAGLGLIMLAPVLLIVSAAVLISSGRPILFRQKRHGFGGRSFDILKFRTMTVCENGPDIRQAQRDDPRITPVGAFLRKHSLDELPQLWNVLHGEMSLVGPRPHAEAHNNHYDPLISSYVFRHHVKPGITGWAQVNGYRGETREIAAMEGRVQHDLWYIHNFSMRLDIYIVYRTALLAFFDNSAY